MKFPSRIRQFCLNASPIVLALMSLGVVPNAWAQTAIERQQYAQENVIISKAFSANLRNGNRSISLEDVKLVVKKEKASRRAQNLLKVIEMDLNSDGLVTASEADASPNDKLAWDIIKVLKLPIDINDLISKPDRLASVRQTRNAIKPVDAEALFKRFDENNDGEITFDERQSVSAANTRKLTNDRLGVSGGHKITDEQRKELAVLNQASTIAGSASSNRHSLIQSSGGISLEAFETGGRLYLSGLRQAQMRNVMTLDLDGDGSLSKTELDTLSDPRLLPRYPVLKKLSEDGQKPSYSYRQITEAADKLVIESNAGLDDFGALFKQLDTDQSGTITRAELSDARQRSRTLQAYSRNTTASDKKADVSCEFPKAGKEVEVVMLGTYEGHALSKISLGPTGRDTSTARINIEDGTTPLYIVASSYDSLLWVVSGATDRVEKFVIQSEKSGVVGLPKDHIHFAPGKCMKYFYDTKKVNKDHPRARAVSNNLGGADIDQILGSYAIAEISIPSGEMPKINRKNLGGSLVSTGPGKPDYIITPDGPIYLDDKKDYDKFLGPDRPDNVSPKFWLQYTRYHPDSTLIDIDIEDVVSQREVKYLDVLPQWHGILQLIKEGKLEEVKGHRATFRVLKSLEAFPSGLAGGYSVTFLVPDGVSVPRTGLSHSRLKFDDGRCFGATCKR